MFMITNNNALLEAADVLVNAPVLEPQTVEKLLGWSLVLDSKRSNESYLFYVGSQPANDISLIQNIDFRMPKNSEKATHSFTFIALKESCTLSGSDITNKFGKPEELMVPPPELSWRYTVGYVYRKEGVRTQFSIGPAPSEKVVSITVDRAGK